MRSIEQFFSFLNDVQFKYVVLRNWDNLPHNVQLGMHSDLDLLVYDSEHFFEIVGKDMTRVYPHPRVQYRLSIGDSYILTDVRCVDDGYYPYDFANNILNNRVWNERGFFTPDSMHHRLALAYHAVHHKGFISPEYKRWLGDVTIDQMVEALKASTIGWERPTDPTVGTHNSYVKGATGVVSKGEQSVKKRQYRFKNQNLIDNEARALKLLNSNHFPKLVAASTDEIEIEDCGVPINQDNIPNDYESQLTEIVSQLKASDVQHRDIRIENIMVKDGVLKLIDFGWAKFPGSVLSDKTPDLLGFPNKAPWGFDDAFSMKKVMKQIEARLETELV